MQEAPTYKQAAGSLSISLLWAAVSVTCAVVSALAVSILPAGLSPVDPLPKVLEVILLCFKLGPVIFVIAALLLVLWMGLSQLLLLPLAVHASRARGWTQIAAVLLSLPLLAMVTLYSRHYLTFSLPGRLDQSLARTAHGLTAANYLWALAAQIPLSLFSFSRLACETQGRWQAQRLLLRLTLAGASMLGIVSGLYLYNIAAETFPAFG
ncbi:hypothetical protein BTR14_05280 [Rhizobium rhizosphaerae]|uniref:Uncharacterized protein n=1 Tax=Xaviernesmea rhizosphaerae TaxID=1672749 RepID=A0ABX3PGY5_9HYPH|nr:hypothetical protein [Xaviernesmea rhizosphaerae]OQP87353.1 hypothetical protein BTR14_05280 [Xaviernesmea rhizosphaerae]